MNKIEYANACLEHAKKAKSLWRKLGLGSAALALGGAAVIGENYIHNKKQAVPYTSEAGMLVLSAYAFRRSKDFDKSAKEYERRLNELSK